MSLLHLQAAADALARPRYELRLARDAADLRAAQALRFEVFNLELDEGLVQSYDSGLDADPFDEACDHLLVFEADQVVGTYRLQTGQRAAACHGYYSEREFDFRPFEPMRASMLELGRACIARGHRNFAVLNLLWKGIATYAAERGVRHLVGCSSLTATDDAVGAAAHRLLAAHAAPPAWRTLPQPGFACRLDGAAVAAPPIPRLLAAYLSLGARLCGPPAVDREFRTIDFLTWLDLESPALRRLQRRGRFMPL